MKYLIVVAAILVVASSQEVIDQLQQQLSQMPLPADKVAKLTEIITNTGKDCLVESADGTTPEQSKATIAFAMPAILDCANQVKDVPLDQADRRETMLKACMAGKVAASGLDDVQVAFLRKMKDCFKAAKAAQAPQ